MRLWLANGSPRGARSNTRLLLEPFLAGFHRTPGHSSQTTLLRHQREPAFLRERFVEADVVLLAFPLYVDATPSIVQEAIEALEPLAGAPGNPALGFVVQSGFSEAYHSRGLERYLERLAARLGGRYLGTVIKGGVEGIRSMPAWMTRGLFGRFHELGRRFGETGEFDPALRAALARPERLTSTGRLLFRVLQALGATRMYWDSHLRRHGAYERRFARPYEAPPAD